MTNAEDLMKRLAVSKKIMERQEQIKPGTMDNRSTNTPSIESYEPVNANYNLPQEFLSEQTPQRQFDPTKPIEETKIINSKLPDEIKRLMIEQPIVQPNSAGTTVISDEIIEGAQRLMKMGNNKITDNIENIKTQQTTKIPVSESYSSNINVSEIKSMIRDVVRDTVRDVVREELKDAGMLVESTQNSNEVIQFKVGQHLFVGKVTKIKKLQK
jgi:hypothetical protein